MLHKVTKLFAIAALTTMCAAYQHSAGAQTGAGTTATVVANTTTSTAANVTVTPGQDDGDKPKAPPKSKLDPPTDFLLEAGYSDWQLHGSANKFRQYATLPSGFFLKELTYVPVMASPGEHFFTSIKGIGGTDYRGEGKYSFNYGSTQIGGYFSGNEFYEDTPDPVDPSARRNTGFNIRQAINKSFALSYQYSDSIQQDRYDAPNPGEDQNTLIQSATASGKLGNGFLKLTTTNMQFTDHTGTLANSNTQTTGASYLWSPIPALDLEAGYSHASIGQTGMQGSQIDVMHFNGDLSIGSGTEVNMSVINRNLSLPNIQNAYVRHEDAEAFAVTQRFKSWRGTLGLTIQDDERVNTGQSYVDVPKWSTLEGRLSGKVLGDYKVSVRGYTQSLFDAPGFSTSDPSNLYWTSKNFVEGRIEGGHDELNYYAVYTFQSDRDASRDSEVQSSQYTVGATWQVSNRINLYGEYHHEAWAGYSSQIAGFPNIGDYLPTTNTGIVQVTYNPNRRTYFSLTYTGFGTENNNPLLQADGNTRGTFVTINGHYRFPKGYEMGLMFAPWTYHDNVVGSMNYSTTVFMLTGSAKF